MGPSSFASNTWMNTYNTKERNFLVQLTSSTSLRCNLLVSNCAWKMSKYGVFLVRIFLYSVQVQENTNQKNSVFGHFPRNVSVPIHFVMVNFFLIPRYLYLQYKWLLASFCLLEKPNYENTSMKWNSLLLACCINYRPLLIM